MGIVKEYKWWLLFIFLFFIVAYLAKLSLKPQINDETIISNFEERNDKILDVISYYKSIVPVNIEVYTMFSSDKLVNLSLLDKNSDSFELSVNESSLISYQVKQFSDYLKWNNDELKTLQRKLEAAHCNSISNNSSSFVLNYKNNNIKSISFSYHIFSKPIADSMIKELSFPCVYKYYDSTVILEMHGGALGNECWSDYIRNVNN